MRLVLRLASLAAVLLQLTCPALADEAPPRETIAWINGHWFDGQRFVERTLYSSGGVFIDRPRKGTSRRVDLKGGFVVPAFGDAHHHGIDRLDGLDEKIATFLKNGIFYVKNPNVIPDYLTLAMRERLNRPDSIDVVFANGGLTSSEGHPAPLHDRLASNGVFPGLAAADMPGRGYFDVDTMAKLDAAWPQILSRRPDFIKVFLNGSADRLPGETKSNRKGVPPDVMRALIKRTRKAGLRVTAHVDTAKDFDEAVRAGVDELGHMPLPRPGHGDLAAFRLTGNMVKRAARRGVTVVMTAGTIPRLAGADWSFADASAIVDVQRSNINLMSVAGVRLAIGSDGISGEAPFVTARNEIDYLARHRLSPNLALLKMWSEATPATIFPGRRIGRLARGFEANFLVLRNDPLRDISAVGQIRLRVKAGKPLGEDGSK